MVQGIGNCLGILDGTYIKIRVPTVDKHRYQTRKCDITTNMLGVCTPDMHFVYVLPGWEGSVANGRVLRDTISCYYLVDAGYTNCEGFLAPFRRQRYHFNEWRQGYQPSTPKEFFNMKHASARNVIERCFGLLKLRWGILRSPSFYPMRVHNRIIIACCLLHNFIRTYMSLDPIEAELGEWLPSNVIDDDESNIRIRTLKRDWSIVYDMLSGKNNSGFGWDEHRQLVVAEDAVWNSYINSHKEVSQFKHRSFPYYDQLIAIYAKDRATRKDAQKAADIIEEIDVEDVATTNTHEERNDFYGCEADVSLDDMDLSAR
ncbi:hypothetical protein GOBAR_DD16454 [Gossypium barbadense]|nr:hypothetical protein GOBAR_DD16454 [Gossypium barbadense]